MDTFSSQYQAIVCIKQYCYCFKPSIKFKGSVLKMLMDISVKDIHNDMIKLFDHGVLAKHSLSCDT